MGGGEWVGEGARNMRSKNAKERIRREATVKRSARAHDNKRQEPECSEARKTNKKKQTEEGEPTAFLCCCHPDRLPFPLPFALGVLSALLLFPPTPPTARAQLKPSPSPQTQKFTYSAALCVPEVRARCEGWGGGVRARRRPGKSEPLGPRDGSERRRGLKGAWDQGRSRESLVG